MSAEESSIQSSLNLGEHTVPTDASQKPPQSSKEVVKGAFGFLAGLFGQKPVELVVSQKEARKRAAQLEESSAKNTLAWLHEFGAIHPDDVLARAKYLGAALAHFALGLQIELSKSLRGGVALAIFLREGIYKNLTDQDNRQLYSSEADFIEALLAHFEIQDAADRVSRLRRSAELWLSIVAGNLPYPPNLSRLYPLLVVPSLEMQLEMYFLLVEAGGGKVPSLAVIKHQVELWQSAKNKNASADNRSWQQVLLEDAQTGAAALRQPTPDISVALAKLQRISNVLTTRLEAQQTKKGNSKKRAASEARPPNPSKPNPILLELQAKLLSVHVDQAPVEIQGSIARLAQSLGWKSLSSTVWGVDLTSNPSAAKVKAAHVCELLTRLLELHDHHGPEQAKAA